MFPVLKESPDPGNSIEFSLLLLAQLRTGGCPLSLPALQRPRPHPFGDTTCFQGLRILLWIFSIGQALWEKGNHEEGRKGSPRLLWPRGDIYVFCIHVPPPRNSHPTSFKYNGAGNYNPKVCPGRSEHGKWGVPALYLLQ